MCTRMGYELASSLGNWSGEVLPARRKSRRRVRKVLGMVEMRLRMMMWARAYGLG